MSSTRAHAVIAGQDPSGKVVGVEWNPLMPNGEALNLAAALGMDISTIDGSKAPGRYGCFAWAESAWQGRRLRGDAHHNSDSPADVAAATRRAIVICAATIGMEMR